MQFFILKMPYFKWQNGQEKAFHVQKWSKLSNIDEISSQAEVAAFILFYFTWNFFPLMEYN